VSNTPDGASAARGAGPAGATGWLPAGEPVSLRSSEVDIVSTATATATATVSVSVVEPADAIATLVLAVPGVAGLHPGRFGEVATYLPGRRVTGVKLGEDRVEVHVVVAYDEPIRVLAQQIHAAVAAVVTVPVQVFVEDLAAAHAA